MPTDSQPNKPYSNSTALKVQVVRSGRRVAGGGSRAQAPTPFLHLHPANARTTENVGLVRPAPTPAPERFVAPPAEDKPATTEETPNA